MARDERHGLCCIEKENPLKNHTIKLLVALAVLLASSEVFAQAAPNPGGEGATPPAGQDPVQATLRTEGGRRVYVATSTIEVRGEIQRPYAFSLSGRSSLGYTYLELPISFLQQIIAVLRRAPF